MGFSMRLGRLSLAVAAATALSLAGCSGGVGGLDPILTADADGAGGKTGKSSTKGRKMIGKPYKVGGRWYKPKHDADYDAVGQASWYGPKFHGKRTANGERFDQNAMTAAHKTLPLPSYVRVTAVKSGKSVVLRVNDRGPFARGRIIDVSKAAAEELGFRRKGHAKVRVEYLAEAEVGGGDRETRIAAKRFGGKGEEKGSSRGLGRYLFGAKESDDGGVEVRLASAAPVEPAAGPSAREALPGVRTVEPVVRRPEAPTTVQAYSAPSDPSDEGGAIEALVTMNAAPLEEDEPVITPSDVDLPETYVEKSGVRVAGAFDMFGAVDAPTIEAPAPADAASSE